jgi:hypothetical protein
VNETEQHRKMREALAEEMRIQRRHLERGDIPLKGLHGNDVPGAARYLVAHDLPGAQVAGIPGIIPTGATFCAPPDFKPTGRFLPVNEPARQALLEAGFDYELFTGRQVAERRSEVDIFSAPVEISRVLDAVTPKLS